MNSANRLKKTLEMSRNSTVQFGRSDNVSISLQPQIAVCTRGIAPRSYMQQYDTIVPACSNLFSSTKFPSESTSVTCTSDAGSQGLSVLSCPVLMLISIRSAAYAPCML